MRTLLKAIALAALVLIPHAAFAQTGACPAINATTVVSPTKLCITASPDHTVLDLGTPVVSGYTVGYCLKSADPATCTPIQQLDLGKPTPNAQNAIWVDRSAQSTLFGTPVGDEYQVVVIVRGENAGLFGRYPQGSFFGQPNLQAPRSAATGGVAVP